MEKLDQKDKQTSSFTNIEEITTKTTSKITTASNDVCSGNHEQIVFEHWKLTMKHPNAKLDKNRTKLIREALKLGYSIEELCQAISGCAITPHNIGLNDKGQRYDGLHIILRNADQIDRFISNFLHPPRQKTKSDQLVQDNINVAEKWLLATERETSNGQY
ncbi:MAG: hypothetical protein BGO43_04150 [Gammaproteobacteria bacterium 39-13]|nr:hypothetical protein [Gammaproteobacteria bacterium]OJV94882.1 MAG: hypothetical protein BGO43_04150 [Gammaproteobacteria bacterium 39-13]